MDIKRFIVIDLNVKRGFGFVKGRDWLGFTYNWQEPVFFHFGDVRMVEYDNRDAEFYFVNRKSYPLNGVQNVVFRTPHIGDEVMAVLGKDEQGRSRLKFWTFLEHYKEVDAKQPRCAKEGCDSILSVYDEYFCRYHDPRDDEEEEEDYVSTGTVYSRAYAHFGNAEMAREAAEMYSGDFI